jgi:hypothetical protein
VLVGLLLQLGYLWAWTEAGLVWRVSDEGNGW